MLKRDQLKAMGIAADNIDLIMDGHGETVAGLQARIKELEEKLTTAEAARTTAETKLASIDTSKDWKAEAERANAKYTAFEKEVAERDAKRAKEEAYRSVLQDAGITDAKRVSKIVKISGDVIGGIELLEDGSIKDRDALLTAIKSEWEDMIPKTVTVGAKAPKPPENTGKPAMSKDDIMRIKDTQDRQKAISEHLELFTNGKK